MFRFLVIVASVVVAVRALGSGAPPTDEVCRSLTPDHGVDPQTETSPFSISINKEFVEPGKGVKVTLKGLNGEKFKGFLVQARAGEKIVGSFDLKPTDNEAQTINCLGGEKNSITHTNPDEKSEITADWLAPNDLNGIVVFKATFVKNGHTFWVAQTSPKLTVGH